MICNFGRYRLLYSYRIYRAADVASPKPRCACCSDRLNAELSVTKMHFAEVACAIQRPGAAWLAPFRILPFPVYDSPIDPFAVLCFGEVHGRRAAAEAGKGDFFNPFRR